MEVTLSGGPCDGQVVAIPDECVVCGWVAVRELPPIPTDYADIGTSVCKEEEKIHIYDITGDEHGRVIGIYGGG